MAVSKQGRDCSVGGVQDGQIKVAVAIKVRYDKGDRATTGGIFCSRGRKFSCPVACQDAYVLVAGVENSEISKSVAVEVPRYDTLWLSSDRNRRITASYGSMSNDACNQSSCTYKQVGIRGVQKRHSSSG